MVVRGADNAEVLGSSPSMTIKWVVLPFENLFLIYFSVKA